MSLSLPGKCAQLSLKINVRLQVLDILIDIHAFGPLNIEEELLCMAPNLSPRSGANMELHLLPIFAVYL